MIRRYLSLICFGLAFCVGDTDPVWIGCLQFMALGAIGALIWMWAEADDPVIWIGDTHDIGNFYVNRKLSRREK